MTTSSEPPGSDYQAYLRTAFLERIAHELRGPAGVTRGALDEIERAMGSQAADARPFFAMARRGIGRVLRLADRLQRTAHLEAHREGNGVTTVDLRNLAADAVRGAEAIEARRDVRVELVACEQPCLVAADAPWLSVAIGEVVGNAIRFAKTAVRVETALADREVSVTILDNGPGFAGPAPRRFEPPFPLGGLGLSLPLVSEVVAAHDGRLSFHDLKAEGASGTRVIVALKLHIPRVDEGRI